MKHQQFRFRRAHLPFGLAAAAAATALVLPVGPAAGQENEIPIPNPGQTGAVKGRPLEIELSATTRTKASVVEFLIRDHPRNGKLGRMISKPEDRTKATITYTADRGTAATTDTFTFAVRYYPGGRFSKEVKMEIELEESEPNIVVTNEADFGEVMLGETEVRELFLQNTGKAGYQRKLELPAPWSISEPVNGFLNLPVGATSSIKVRFTPKQEGEYEYPFTINPNPGGTTRLAAHAFAPFAVKTSEVRLDWENNSRARIGEIQLEVRSPKIMPIQLLPADPRLLVDGGPNQMIVPGKTFASRIYLPAADSMAFQGAIEISAGSFRLPVSVHAAAPPGYIEVDTGSIQGESLIDFGSLEPGAITQKGFLVRNVGGHETRVRFAANDPFQVLAAGGGSTLSPGESETFAIRFQAPEGDNHVFDSIMKVTAESGQLVQVRLKAITQAPGRASIDLPNAFSTMPPGKTAPGTAGPDSPPARPDHRLPADRPPDSIAGLNQRDQLEALRSPLGFVTVPLVERNVSAEVPGVFEGGMSFERHGNHHVTVAWDLPRKDLTQFELERRGYREHPETRAMESVWLPYHDVEFKENDGRMFATIRGLNPDELCEFRVFTIGKDGTVSNPVPFVSRTKPLMDWTWIYAGFGALLVIAAGVTTWKFMTARRIESAGAVGQFIN